MSANGPTRCAAVSRGPRLWLRINPIDDEALVHIDQEGVTCISQRKQKVRPTAIARIRSNPAKAHSIAAGLLNDFQSQLVFGLKDPFALRDARFVASLRIVGPFFGQVEPRINGSGKTSLCQNPEDRHLSVIDLT